VPTKSWFALDHDAIDLPMGIEQPPALPAVIVGCVEKSAVDPILRGVPRLGFVGESGRHRRMAIGFAADADNLIHAHPCRSIATTHKLRTASSIVESRRARARLLADPISVRFGASHALDVQIIGAMVDEATMKFRRITNL
jgi:hypothetical protein